MSPGIIPALTKTMKWKQSYELPQDDSYYFTYQPTSPWLNPIEELWRHFRREVTHCKIFETVILLIETSYNFFSRYNTKPKDVLSIIGALPS